MRNILFLGILSLLLTFSCRKDPVEIRNASSLEFSQDTVFLDTIFSTIGSSTRILKVFNRSDEDVKIPAIRFGKGNASYFRMNVNGQSGNEVLNAEILAKDSLYILLEVTADVLGAPELLYTDSLVFNLDGRSQDVKLVTLAKDAFFHLPNQTDTLGNLILRYKVIANDTSWSNSKPHVVYGYILVSSGAKLTIPEETEIHFHSGSGIIVAGSLEVDPFGLSSYDRPVVFQGDRLEPWYEDVPGQWGGLLGGILLLGESTNNLIQNTLIKNATIGLRVDSNNTGTSNVSLKNVRIFNSSRVGLYGGFAHIVAENTVVANSGLYNLYVLGGRYRFIHCTFANYWPFGNRNTPSVGLFNFFEDGNGNRRTRDIIDCYFGNCIVYGSQTSELAIGEESGGLMNYKFNSALIRIEPEPEDNSYDLTDLSRFENLLINEDPNFVNTVRNDYDLDSLSPAMDRANLIDGAQVPLDIKGQFRSFNGIPDLGAFERIE